MTAIYAASPVKRYRRTKVELAAIDYAIADAVEADHPVTLRGVFYRVVSMGAVEKTETAYNLIGRELLKLRRTGVVPYWHITDGTRWISKPNTWTGLDQMLADAATSYRRALWHDQAAEVHVFTEKDAISGVVLPVTEQFDVPLGVLRGYASESFAHSAAEAIKGSPKRNVFVYQLGDHDPSGVDAWRAFRERVAGFLGEPVTAEMAARVRQLGLSWHPKVGTSLGVAEHELSACGCEDECEQSGCGTGCSCRATGGCLCDGNYCECDCGLADPAAYMFLGGDHFRGADSRMVVFARLAVTEDQIRRWGLPTRPTKQTDSRAAKFRGGSVEVDAIPAGQLRQIVEDAITRHIEPEAWQVTQAAEESEREILTRLAGNGAS
jgi:hypothetical protein